MTFKSLIPPSTSKPPSQTEQSRRNKAASLSVVRDAFSLSSWVAIGAVLQSILFLVGGRLAFLPAVTLILYRTADAFLQAVGMKKNPHMQNVIKSKHSAQIPNKDGTFTGKPASSDVVVFHIGARTNHPLGLFSPGFKTIGDFMEGLQRDIEARASDYGYLGGKQYVAMDRATNNEIMYTMYFRDADGLHRFAHDAAHREVWNWWNQHYKSHEHLMIYHEIFECKAGGWENIYVNDSPNLMGATRFEGVDGKGERIWHSPVVDATRGLLATSAGRMQRGSGGEHKGYVGVDEDGFLSAV